jgi:hypothetical protein
MSNIQKLLYETSKKDEDARLVQQGENLFLETTAPPDSNIEEEEEPKVSMMEESALAVMVDMRVLSIYYMFLMHHFVVLMILMLSFPLYYFTITQTTVIVSLLVVSCVLFCVLYCLMIFFRRRYMQLAIACLVCWALCGTVIVGMTSNLLQNTAPIQFVAMLWAETIAVMVYCKLSPRMVLFKTAAFYMTLAALCVWAIGIPSFIVQGDWPSAIVILVLGMACTAHGVHQIYIIDQHAYNSSWQDVLLSIVQFYKVWPN